MRRLWSNAQIFYTPWYKTRRKFLSGFVNLNGSKLLNCGPDFAYVRNRQEECVYYTVKFWGFHYTLTRSILRDSDGLAVNGFMAGISIAFDPNKTDEEKRETAESIKEEKKVVRSGWIFTLQQAVNELNAVSVLAPDLEWFSPTLEKEL